MLPLFIRTHASCKLLRGLLSCGGFNFSTLCTSFSCCCPVCCTMVAAAKQQALITYIILLLHMGNHNASAQPSLESLDSNHSPAPQTSNASGLSTTTPQLAKAGATCELEVLNQLGWRPAWNPNGYCINASLPSTCSLYIWQSLGCLTSLTNLTLTGSLPGLPDSWASNSSFSSLQALDLSLAQLNGTLPASWASPSSFPMLR